MFRGYGREKPPFARELMLTRLHRSLALGVCLCFSASSALAQNRPPAPANAPLSQSLSGMARVEYEVGKILYADGDFASVALKFQCAYEESSDPRLLWNIAVVEKNLCRYVRVYTLIECYLSEGVVKLTPKNK